MLVDIFLWLVFAFLVVVCFVWVDKHEELVEAFLEKISRDLRRCAMFGTCDLNKLDWTEIFESIDKGKYGKMVVEFDGKHYEMTIREVEE
ncbi:hypothetical protein H702_07180 [Streptococcus equinus JB1]|uniref:Uncharacterized protein n=2 Tax=Streptococcus equinus JB1 TaxID=1294274 RepID=A0A091BRV2_STREI|nr:hypothetical protein [Streptococcus equinus]KFN87434.1 hypothetical protein H702_07180 [Streptococcus equinus JB1]